MRRLILLILALATLLPSLAFGYDILILQSSRNEAYDGVLKEFRSQQKSSLRLLVLSDYSEVDVARIVREDRPRMILALGDAALKETRNVRNTPVLAVMALGVNNASSGHRNLNGISMFAAPGRYIDMFQKMKVSRVGVIHNRARSGWYLRMALHTAGQGGIELVVREVKSAQEIPGQLATLAGKVDALWMLPDSTAVTRETAEAYFHFGQDNSVPVVSFAGSYLGLGAATAVEIDHIQLGRQAADLATATLNGGAIAQRVVFPQRTTIKVNKAVLKRLGKAYAAE